MTHRPHVTDIQLLRAGAIAAWKVRFGSNPREPLAWGPFAEKGWAWRMAEAVLYDLPIPRLGGDEDFDYDEIIRHVKKTMRP